MIPQSDIDNWFQYHAPNQNQLVHYNIIRDEGKKFAELLNRLLPDSADKSACFRELRKCIMSANLTIACNTPTKE